VTVSARGRTATFTRKDACGKFTGHNRQIGPVFVGPDGRRVTFGSHGNGTAKLAVKVAGKTVMRRTVYADVTTVRDKRIWDGTDAFFNYCLKGNHELTSSGGRLYCVKSGSTEEFVSFK
jgi:hypothetical protein